MDAKNIRGRGNLKSNTRSPLLHVQHKDKITTSRRLLDREELPAWQQAESKYILTGYRENTPSVWQCIQSWSYLHNESVNIYSHVFGAILFFLLLAGVSSGVKTYFHRADSGEIAVLTIYVLGVAICYVLSVSFHTLLSHSESGAAFGIQLDFQGIIILIWSATSPLIYYTFYTETKLQTLYTTVISVLALTASIITFTPAFRKPETKPLRAGVFGSLALSTLLCPIHGLLKHGWTEQSARFPMWAVGGTLFFNVLGASFYVFRFPEQYYPRKYDIFGASHQLMHCAIVVASLVWFSGMVVAHNNVHSPIVNSG